MHRICLSNYAHNEPAFRKSGKYRFDDPQQKFGTLHCARDFGTCFLETLLPGTGTLAIPRSNYNVRSHVLLLLAARKLILIDFHSTRALATLGLNLSIVAGGSYLGTQQLSRLAYTHRSRPHGILYRSRFDPEQAAIVLFDRGARLVRIYPGSKGVALSSVQELSDTVRSKVPFVLI